MILLVPMHLAITKAYVPTKDVILKYINCEWTLHLAKTVPYIFEYLYFIGYNTIIWQNNSQHKLADNIYFGKCPKLQNNWNVETKLWHLTFHCVTFTHN